MDNTCKRNKFSDGEIDDPIPISQALVLERSKPSGDFGGVGKCLTNVPHLVVHHSPTGFEFGYGGSGPADLALNVCQFYLNSIGYLGEKTECFDGICFSLAVVLHQDFKRAFIEGAPLQGISIPWVDVKHWFEEHITDQLKQIYSSFADELED